MSNLQEEPSALKREHQKIKFSNFLLSCIRIQIANPNTDPDPDCESGCRYRSRDPSEYGSTTLLVG
jgi:hypothetical protein